MSLTKAVAGEYAKHNIRANAIYPGIVLTERAKQRMEGVTGASGVEALKERYKTYPFAIGEPENIAASTLFLASDESQMVTGAIVPADGGLSAY
jgi:NAD(P)-dependent dehydrogenase (short-subunit alcohol dehydrogenase family)